MANEVPKIIKVKSWTIPMFGNSHCAPYGVLVVSDGETTKECRTQENPCHTYITFKRKRYIVVNSGQLHFPRLHLESADG